MLTSRHHARDLATSTRQLKRYPLRVVVDLLNLGDFELLREEHRLGEGQGGCRRVRCRVQSYRRGLCGGVVRGADDGEACCGGEEWTCGEGPAEGSERCHVGVYGMKEAAGSVDRW